MGQLFGQGGGLSNPGTLITDQATGQSAVGKPSDVLNTADQALRSKTQGQELNNILGQGSGGPAADAQLPTIGTPSYQQAAGSGAMPGSGNVLSPGLNKAGKLATLLQGGLQGAMAGRAASEQAVLASGGRRSGGAGMGFEAGYQLPWQRAGMQNQLEQQQAQTQLLKSESQNVDVPGVGTMPGWLAKALGPAGIRAQAAENTAQTGAGARVSAAQIGAGARTEAAETGAEARTGAAKIGADARIRAAQLNLGPIAKVPQNLQDELGLPPELPLRMLNQAETAANKPLTVVQGENGPAIVNKQLAGAGVGGTPKNLGIGSPRLGGAMQVADPNNPGQTMVTTSGQAVRGGAAGTGSSSLQVPRQAAKAAVPTDIGNQKVNFTTMIQHADLLREAARALNNGDTQTLAGLKNAFKNEFGYSGPITAQAIADAYGGEVTNVIAKGHITDAEASKTGKTINLQKQNFKTVDDVLSAYQSLAQSKMNMLDKQTQSAIASSQPKNNASKSGGQQNLSNFHINPKTGERIGWDGKKWQTAPPQASQ
jgi:hypothetical protein